MGCLKNFLVEGKKDNGFRLCSSLSLVVWFIEVHFAAKNPKIKKEQKGKERGREKENKKNRERNV